MDSKINWKKNIFLFLTSQTISLFGSTLVQYAITWYISLQTKSPIMVTVSIICGFLPMLFLAPFAGVWADRYNKKMLIVLSDSLIATATLILALVFLSGYSPVWLLFFASFIRAVGSGIQSPAVSSFIPQLVPKEELTRVNSVNTTVQSVITLISPMLAGALLTIANIELIFFIDVVTAALAVFILLKFLHVPIHSSAIDKQGISYFTDMREGFIYIRNHKFVKTIFIFNALYFVLVAPLAFLTNLQVVKSFGEEVWRLTAIEIAFSIGMIIGGVLMVSWKGFKNKLHTMVLANAVIAIFTIGLGIIPVFWIYLIMMGVIGVAMPVFNTPFTVLIQQKVDQNFLGRVFSVLSMIVSSIMPISMLIYGPIAEFVRIEYLLIVTGTLMLVHSSFMLSNKVLQAEVKG